MMRKIVEGICKAVAWALPKGVVYFVLIRAWAFATSGKFGSKPAPDLLFVEVLDCWEAGRAVKPELPDRDLKAGLRTLL